MKKFLSLLLAAIMLLSCLPAMAEESTEWEINQYTGLASRRSSTEKLESIVVPAEVDGIAVRGIEYMAFNMYKNFKQLTIADSAVMLDRRVLRDLLKLEAVDLPENLLIIREGNFTNLPKLTSVVIPANVVLVHSSFNKCASLTSITFEGMCPIFVTAGTFGMFTDLPADCVIYVPDNQVSAYKAAFADREDVVARIQPSGRNAERIDRPATESGFAFDASTGTITSYTGTADYLVIPATIDGVQVKHIADFAFETNVCCIIIPEGVETIGRYSLGHELLTYVSLPSTLTNVGSGAVSSSYLSAISYPTADVPAYDAAAFEAVKGDAWQLILPYGTTQEQVDAFAAYMTPSAPKAVVKASIIEPYKFPTLDAEAGAPFIGNWFSVAGKDVMGDFTDYYPATIATLNADGTGMINMDGDEMAIAWFVDSGYAIIAPRAQDGSAYEDQAFAYANIDENGRLYVDFGYIGVICEQEGATYAAPARPETPWPELDLSNATYFIGTWEAIEYNVEGENYPAELIGTMTLTLNDDGSALLIEGEEEPYPLRWFAEYAVAYVGETMSDKAEITFDGTGNIKLDMIEAVVILAPKAAVKVITGADELLGDWYDDLGNKLTVTNDGNLTVTYASDGWVRELKWDMVDGAATVTEGLWVGCPIVLENGIVIISGDNAFQLFSVDGDLSAYYGDDEDDMPEAQPIGAEGEPYFGVWKADMYGMEVILTMNPDGTCAMEMMGEAEPAVWSVVDGKANVMGDELYIDGDGKLVYEGAGMVFEKAEDASSDDEMTDEELLALLALLGQMASTEGSEATELPEEMKPYVGTWHLVYMATGGLTGDLRNMGLTGKLVLNADGTGEMSGVADDSGSWYDDEGQVRFGKADTALTLLDGGFLRYGTELAGYMVFSQNESATWAPAPVATSIPAPVPTAAPAAPVVNGDGGYVGKTFVLTSAYTVYAGQEFPVDAAAFGEYKVCFHEDGKVTFVQAGLELPGDYLSWSINAEGAYVLTYAMGATVIMEYVFTPADGALSMDYYGTMMTFTPAE